MELKKLFSLDPEKSLKKLWLFWLVIIIPIFFGLVMILTTLPFSHSFSWDTEGVIEFLSLSKLQLSIISLAIPFGTVVAVMHRSEQTAKQIQISQEQSRFKNFYEHRSSFLDEFGLIADKVGMEKRDVSFLYKKLFINVTEYDYRPFFPEEWYSLYLFLEKFANAEETQDLLSLGDGGLLNDLEDLVKVDQAVQDKISFMVDFVKLLDAAYSCLIYENVNFGIMDNFDVHDDDDFFRKAQRIADECIDRLENLKLVIDHLFFDSFLSFFSSNEQKQFATLISRVSVRYCDSLEHEIEFFYSGTLAGIENIYEVGEDGMIDNSRMIILSFSFFESFD
ncbi:hypothetical protein [Vreelandella stevensii]|uniref:hypothetical protein n=1 Tax=Vreelandella stevensii TaxID=502821 RepID=UPI00403AC3CF